MKQKSPSRSGPLASVDSETARQKLTELLEFVPNLKVKTASSAEFKAWNDDVTITLARLYGADSEEYASFGHIWFTPGISYSGQPQSEWDDAFGRGIEQASLFLDSRKRDWKTGTASPKLSRVVAANSRDVFVVHGHDHGIKETVARFLSKLKLNPIILHEQADQGNTLIEKFEKHASVSFAIAILSADDLAVAKNKISGGKSIEESLQARARQNVIFEFGYFIGTLGRKNVVAIVEDGVETPSDYSGVLYVPFDASHSWHLKLVKELKAAGLEIDANDAF